jgi:hypothetical protein
MVYDQVEIDCLERFMNWNIFLSALLGEFAMQPENVVYLHERGTRRVIDLRRFTRKPFRRATIFACQNRYYAVLIFVYKFLYQ